MNAAIKFSLGALLLMTSAALGEQLPVRRVAIVVGSNQAAPGLRPLRYAEDDARSVARALVEVGQFSAEDVTTLFEPTPQAVLDALDSALQAMPPAGESLLIFYYSGHGDSQALWPGGHALPLESLKQRLESKRASVRIGIVDSCNGGGWTNTKGVHAEPPFDVSVPLALSGEGAVLLSSSSGQESAHESQTLRGSFFTHYFVAGLRGAAAPLGDGVVTLGQAFAYAKENTVRDTAALAVEPQHPSFFMNLRGRSDLLLARIAGSSTVVDLRERHGPLQLIDLGTGLMVLEVPSGERTLKLSLPAGHYLIRRDEADGVYAREITVESGKSIEVREDDLRLFLAPETGAKGPESPLRATEGFEFLLEAELAAPDGTSVVLLGDFFPLTIGIGYRFNRHWMLAAYGGYALGSNPCSPPDTAYCVAAHQVQFGLEGTLHFGLGTIDPWLAFAAGGAALHVNSGSDSTVVMPARLRFGIDFALSPSVSVAPFVSVAKLVVPSDEISALHTSYGVGLEIRIHP